MDRFRPVPLQFASSSLTLAAGVARENEDAMAVSDDVVVVVDGAGLTAELRAGCRVPGAGCRHSVSWFAQSVAQTFHALLAPRCNTMVDALATTIARVRESHASTCDLGRGSPSATVAAWRTRGNRIEYLVLCDASLVLVDHDRKALEISDRRLQRLLDSATPAEGVASDDPHGGAALRAARRAVVEQSRNQPGGFWCVHTDPGAASHATHGELDIDAHAGVVACTDGAARGYDLLEEHDLDEFARHALTGPLQGLADTIRGAESRREGELRAQGVKVDDDLTIVATPLAHPSMPRPIV